MPKFGPQNFFLKDLAWSVTRYHGQPSSCTILEKTNDPILRKFNDGRTDRQMDESDFIGCFPTKSRVQNTKILHGSLYSEMNKKTE